MLRREWLIAITALLAVRCSSADTPPMDGGEDAGMLDLGQRTPFACGALSCVAEETLCQIELRGECAARINGAECGAEEEACAVDAETPGCRPASMYGCAFLSDCRSCACLLSDPPCGTPSAPPTCRQNAAGGLELTCPP